MVLLVALIVLVALMLGANALVRSVDTSASIAGNLSFKEAAQQMGDIGVEAAATALATYSASPNNNAPSGCSSGCQYFATVQSTDAKGVPSTADWSQIPSTSPATGYAVQYVVDRLCQNPPITDIGAQCLANFKAVSGSQRVGAPVFNQVEGVNYRITVRITGPKSTESFVQAVLSR